MRTLTALTTLFAAVAIVGCAKSDNSAADTHAATPAGTPAPAPTPPPAMKAADVTGKWNFVGKNERGDSTIVTYAFTAPKDTKKWTMQFTGKTARKDKIPVRLVAMKGDSLVIASGPFASVLRKNVKVKTQGVLRLKDGKLVGNLVAHYSVKTADSVRNIPVEGTRAASK